MVKISVLYQGELRCLATHQPSQTQLHTDAPTDNQGKGQSFSPTDLVATALATCMMTIMGIKAQEMNINLTGTHIEIEKIMTNNPRKIAALPAKIKFPTLSLDEKSKKILENAALTCPVAKSIHPDIQFTVEFEW
ncbi:MAG: OsmC family protein [Bacteroidia bacterium]|nr:OsmC family protein [Bacteroidia bacterium]MDW8348237.1 OsmC family protein [Bacteroidia bacterium]